MAMFSSLVGAATLTVLLEQRVIFVYPHLVAPSDGQPPRHESTLRGVVKLELASKRRVKALRVDLKGVCEPQGAGLKYHDEIMTTTEKQLDIQLADEELEVGEHTFAFDFNVAASTACSFPTRFSHTRHTITATLDFATGMFKSCSSIAARFWVVALRHEPGEVPDPFDLAYEHLSSDLGPIRLAVFSPQLTLGALLKVSLLVASPQKAVSMHSIHCILTTSCLVQVGAGRPPVSAPDANHPVRHVADTASSPTLSDSMNVETRLKKGEEWLHGGIFVMPGCNPEFEAPTTLAGSDATHRMSHKLSIQIRYQVPGDISLNATTICLPIILDSCTSLADSLRLPPYAPLPQNIEIRYSPWGSKGTLCMCEFSVGERLERYRGLLEAAEERPLELEDEAPRGVYMKEESTGLLSPS